MTRTRLIRVTLARAMTKPLGRDALRAWSATTTRQNG